MAERMTADFIPTPAHMLARTENPVTSHEAAVRVVEFVRGHLAQILSALIVMPDGGTQEEIAAVTGLDKYQVNKRMAELERGQHVARSDRTRVGSSGRRMIVWEAIT